MRYGGHDRNIIFYDNRTRQTRCARHLDFDESHYYDSKRPPYAQKLRNIYNAQIEQQTAEKDLQQQQQSIPISSIPDSTIDNHTDESSETDVSPIITQDTNPNEPTSSFSGLPTSVRQSKHIAQITQDTIQIITESKQSLPLFETLHQAAIMPFKQTVDASGYYLSTIQDAVLPPQHSVLLRTGIKLNTPCGKLA